MSDLNTWLRRQARRDQRRPRLYEALLTNRSWAYARYRLRFLIWRVLLRALLHLIEIVAFSTIFSLEFLAPVLIYRSGMIIALSLHWGGLEQLRHQVRQAARDRRWSSVRPIIDAWLLATVVVGLLLIGGGTSWILFTPDPHLGFSVFDTYALGCLIRLTLDMTARTYHSGIFALRRVYRPLWSLLLGDGLDVIMVLLLWPWLGLWGFGISLAAVGIVRTGLVFFYARRTYSSTKIPPLAWGSTIRSWRQLHRADLWAFIRHGAANATAQIDAALIITLVMASGRMDDMMGLAILLYLLRPFIAAGFSWARLFYFDFKRLALQTSRFFQQRFERFLRKLALVFASFTALLAFVWTAVFWRGSVVAEWGVILPFFMVRSVFGLYQVQAFSYGRYRYLFSTTVVLGLTVAGIGLFSTERILSVLAITAVLAIIALFIKPGGNLATEPIRPTVISLSKWLGQLAKQKNPVRLNHASVDRKLTSPAKVARQIAAMTPGTSVARFGQSHILWFESKASAKSSTVSQIVTTAAGCLSSLTVGSWQPDGRMALRQFVTDRKECVPLRDLLAASLQFDLTIDQLKEEFTARFNNGELLDIRRGVLQGQSNRFKSPELRQILNYVARESSGESPGTRPDGKYDVAVYCPGGEPLIVFAMDSTIAPEQRSGWRKQVRIATYAHSLKCPLD